ncbi:MAG: hypothetical protein LBS01_00885 [Prevotellaceae bacterium]|jgi:hypothetical protein|nr:hypothetical protein [Prevotellaceae bacterium]
MIKRLINKWFYPFNRIFEVVVVSENETYCENFKNMLCGFFEKKEIRRFGIEHFEYDGENNFFELIMEDFSAIKFKLICQTLPNGEWHNAVIDGDIFIPVFCLDKHKDYEYNCLPHEIDSFLGKINQKSKNAIVALMNIEKMYDADFSDISHFEKSINKIYRHLCENSTLDKKNTELSDCGHKILTPIIAVFQRHINDNGYKAHSLCNFFNSDISYGKDEFMCNFLMHLLSFDKLNHYKYIFNS